MKTVEDKAKELVNFHLLVGSEKVITEHGTYKKTMPFTHAQIHAIITVEQIIEEWENQLATVNEIDLNYWNAVRAEIENL